MIPRALVAVVREMLERHWSVYEIAAKSKIDVALVQQIIDMLT